MAGDEFGDGVWLVELAPLTEPEALDAVIAATLSIRRQDGMTLLESIVDGLRGRHVLLIVDNCEHLITSARGRRGTHRDGMPERDGAGHEPGAPGLGGERVPTGCRRWRLQTPSSCSTTPAMAADESITLNDADLTIVAEICERLDGIPLAIELGRARTPALVGGPRSTG